MEYILEFKNTKDLKLGVLSGSQANCKNYLESLPVALSFCELSHRAK